MTLKKKQFSKDHPLAGLRFLVTRRDNKESSLTKMLESKGASVLVAPLAKIVSPASWESFDKTVHKFEKIDWAIFTSGNGVLGSLNRLKELKYSASKIFSKIKIACIGQSTARKLVENGITPELVPLHYQTEGLISALKKYGLKGKTFWLIQAESPRELLINELKKHGSKIIFTPVYKSVPIFRDYNFLICELEQSKLDWILFVSPSAVKLFNKILPHGLWFSLSNIPKIGCIGQITADAVKRLGWQVEAKPEIQDFEHLVQKICEINLKNKNFL